MTVTREQIQDSLDWAKGMSEYDWSGYITETIRTVLQSALDGMDAPDTAALDALATIERVIKTQVGGTEWNNTFKSIRAALTRPSVGWMPIETAPKDKLILIYSTGFDVGYYSTTFNKWCTYTDGSKTAGERNLNSFAPPTHWMPLPAAPKDGEV